MKSQSSEDGQAALILEDLIQKVASLSEPDRELIMPDIRRLQECFKNARQVPLDSDHLRQEATGSEVIWRESERIYRAIGEAIDYGVWICAPDGRNLYASQSFLDLVGITQQQCSDFGWGNTLHPEDAERTIAAWKECVRTGGTWDIEHRFLGKDGQYHPILARGVPVRDQQGDIICWAGINLDISRLKQAELTLRASEARLRASEAHLLESEAHLRMSYEDLQNEIAERKRTQEVLEKALTEVENEKNRLLAVMEALPIGLAIYDKDGADVIANSGYEEIWGNPRPMVRSIEDYPLYKAFWVDSGKPVEPEEWASAQAFQKGRTITGQVIEIQGFDGSHRIVLNSGAPIRDTQGEITGSAVAIMDITERRQMERALEASERKYRELIQYAPSAIYEIDFRTGRLTAVNDSMVILSGYTREELLEMTAFDLLDEESKALFQGRVRQWLAGEKPDENVEYRVKAKDGHIIYAVLNSTFTRDEHGKPLGATVIGHDITERKRAETALVASEAKFRTFFENINEGLYIMEAVRDEQGQVIDWIFREVNPAGLHTLMTTRENLVGRRVSEIRTPEAQARFAKYFVSVLLNGEPTEYEATMNGRDLLVTVFRMNSNTTAAATIDITERKQAEEALKESEAAQRRSAANERARANELETVMDAAPAIIWISRDPQCREMIGNRYSYDFLNISQGENVSKTAPDKELGVQQYRMEKDGRPVPISELPMQVAAATGKPAKDYAFDLIYENGTVFHLFGNVNPLLDPEGKPYGAIGVFVDLTTVRHLEEEQISAKAEIEVQRRLMDQREQERMGIARDLHDGPIQTLSSSVFHLQMIKEVFTDQALQIELSQIGVDIKNCIHEIREVLNDLRPPALMHFGFTRMIQMYTEDLRGRFPAIEIETEVMDDTKVLSDEARLALFRIYQAGMNNIIRHSGASKVRVAFQIEPDGFFLELQDNGKGFETTSDFTQLTREGHFGLVGMKERAQAIGGEFLVSSEPGHGTTILVKGPLSGKNLK